MRWVRRRVTGSGQCLRGREEGERVAEDNEPEVWCLGN